MKINLIGFRIDIKSCLVASAFKIKEKSSHQLNQLIRPSQSDEMFRLLKLITHELAFLSREIPSGESFREILQRNPSGISFPRRNKMTLSEL
jgi:hypothetical protein